MLVAVLLVVAVLLLALCQRLRLGVGCDARPLAARAALAAGGAAAGCWRRGTGRAPSAGAASRPRHQRIQRVAAEQAAAAAVVIRVQGLVALPGPAWKGALHPPWGCNLGLHQHCANHKVKTQRRMCIASQQAVSVLNKGLVRLKHTCLLVFFAISSQSQRYIVSWISQPDTFRGLSFPAQQAEDHLHLKNL